MSVTRRALAAAVAILIAAPQAGCRQPVRDPLPSWRETPAKHAIETYVARATGRRPSYVAPEGRIAVFSFAQAAYGVPPGPACRS